MLKGLHPNRLSAINHSEETLLSSNGFRLLSSITLCHQTFVILILFSVTSRVVFLTSVLKNTVISFFDALHCGSTSVERRQWSAVSGAPSMERELIERSVGRAPSVER